MNEQEKRLYNDVMFLTEIQPARNYNNIESLEKAAEYISRNLEETGYETAAQTWMFSGREYKNILASYRPEKKRRLTVGAHYDVAGDQPGADDNASGIAGLLETARLVKKHEPDTEFGIDFVAYCLEEPPFFGTTTMGSHVHARSLHNNNTDIAGMICYEMIGYFSDEKGSQEFPIPALSLIYPSKGNFIMVVGIDEHKDFTGKIHSLMSKGSEIDVRMISFPDGESLAGMSDQRNYWKFGYPAVMINDTSQFRNKNYHQVSDTIDTLDFKKMAAVVNSTYNAIRWL
ncbi:MAG: M28 family peptidase [Methanosarcina sp.]